MSAVATTFPGVTVRTLNSGRSIDSPRFSTTVPEPRAVARFAELLADGAILALHDDDAGGFVALLADPALADDLEAYRARLARAEEEARDARDALRRLADDELPAIRRTVDAYVRANELSPLDAADYDEARELRYALDDADEAARDLRACLDALDDAVAGEDGS